MGEKLQTSNSKLQRNSKLQTSIPFPVSVVPLELEA
jgi:hypothetical protein